MKSDSVNARPTERNKSIIWARYQIDAKDWLVLATRSTKLDGVEVLSASVLSPDGKTVFESLVKPQGEVSSEIFAMHGVDCSIVFKAQDPQEFLRGILKCLEGKRILSWNFEDSVATLNSLSRRVGASDLPIFGESVQTHYKKFSGDAGELKTKGPSPADECKALIALVTEMASTSQIHNSEDVARQGWTAEFYKPTKTPAQKFKDMLGF